MRGIEIWASLLYLDHSYSAPIPSFQKLQQFYRCCTAYQCHQKRCNIITLCELQRNLRAGRSATDRIHLLTEGKHQSVKTDLIVSSNQEKAIILSNFPDVFILSEQCFPHVLSMCQKVHISVHQKWEVIDISKDTNAIKASNCRKSSERQKFQKISKHQKSTPWWFYTESIGCYDRNNGTASRPPLKQTLLPHRVKQCDTVSSRQAWETKSRTQRLYSFAVSRPASALTDQNEASSL